MFTETLGQAMAAIENDLAQRQVILGPGEGDWLNAFSYGGLAYGTDREVHAEIATIKGKKTWKFAHAHIWRSESGRYEWLVYLL